MTKVAIVTTLCAWLCAKHGTDTSLTDLHSSCMKEVCHYPLHADEEKKSSWNSWALGGRVGIQVFLTPKTLRTPSYYHRASFFSLVRLGLEWTDCSGPSQHGHSNIYRGDVPEGQRHWPWE